MSLKQSAKIFKYASVAATAFLVLVFVMLPILSLASSISRGYSTSDSELAVGMAAALSQESDPENPSVERAAISNKEKFVGIVTTKEASSITVADKDSEVIITTQGNVKALVNDIEGEIKKGDALTPSPIKGILMKLNGETSLTVAFAMEDFSNSVARTETVKTENGDNREVKIGAVSIGLLSPKNDATQGNRQSSSLVTFVKSLTGRDLAQWKIFAAALVFFTLLVTVGSIVYGAVHSTIGAVGRNPLAKKEIYKHFIRIMGMALIILALGSAILYNLLWL